ncbi:Cytochrome c oxidase subunit NDUFA4 [Galemys pyrenaicus]|uniref:Cytochrome c oxidase subunit NDUFA4 n=1 Tax=Galemys pyrenaicus TaxID=202257 RepID=A0A8J6A9I6_GALPY|nr:Cytochrome c oxidase subunit NDUFA4 [Galemys pyrenaicus]
MPAPPQAASESRKPSVTSLGYRVRGESGSDVSAEHARGALAGGPRPGIFEQWSNSWDQRDFLYGLCILSDPTNLGMGLQRINNIEVLKTHRNKEQEPKASPATMHHQILSQVKKHPILIPSFVFIGARDTGVLLYVMCLALFNLDVSWDRKNNPEPWNERGLNDQYKIYS